MIHAINKNGTESYFSERVWNLMPKHKNGWVEFSDNMNILVPDKIIEFQQKKREAVVAEKEIVPEPIIKQVEVKAAPKTRKPRKVSPKKK
jgi:hypothetical protein